MAHSPKHKLSRDTVFLMGDVLPLLDFFGVLLAAYLGTLIYGGLVPRASMSAILDGGGRAALAAAVLAPFILCDRTFVSFASGGQTAALIRCYAVRFLMFAGAVSAIGLASHALANLPRTWLALWFASSLVVTALTRLVLVATLRHLERTGVLAETVAIVGAGPHADRLVRALKARGRSVAILGVFDDPASPGQDALHPPTGSIADLIELGKSQPMDWILLALPESDDARRQALVHRLKALAVPVGVCLADVDDAPPAATPASPGWNYTMAALETVLPRWILTLAELPLAALRLLFVALGGLASWRARSRPPPLACVLDDYDLERFTPVAAGFGQQRFGYVVTPNADHLIRLHQDRSFRALYADAAYALLDSRFIANLLRVTRKLRLPVCTGSDLTVKLFAEVIVPDDRLVLIGGSSEQAAQLTARYGLKHLAHFNPPMGFLRDPQAMYACARFVETHSPFRFCLLAVGSPQQEAVAQHLKVRGIARGLALCVGGSIAFLTGDERRAPRWLQRCGMEWLFRLLQAPRRMAQRYLVQGPRIFGLLGRTTFVLRTPAGPRRSATPGATKAAGLGQALPAP